MGDDQAGPSGQPRGPDREREERERGSPSRRLTFRAAGRTEEFFDRLQEHYRECRRKDADVEADVRIVLADGTEFDHGTARIKNVSPTGALLVGMKLSKGAYPAGKFGLELTMRSGGYQGIGFKATPVRFVTDEQGIGVKFEEIFVTADGEGEAEARGEEGKADTAGADTD